MHWSISVVIGGKLQGIISSFPCVNQGSMNALIDTRKGGANALQLASNDN
jgi:hypothetical protein